MKVVACNNLLLVSTRLTATSGLFEFPSLGSDHRLDVGSGETGSAEFAVGLASRSAALKQNGALASGGGQGQLIEGHDFASVLEDPLAGLLGDVNSGDL